MKKLLKTYRYNKTNSLGATIIITATIVAYNQDENGYWHSVPSLTSSAIWDGKDILPVIGDDIEFYDRLHNQSDMLRKIIETDLVGHVNIDGNDIEILPTIEGIKHHYGAVELQRAIGGNPKDVYTIRIEYSAYSADSIRVSSDQAIDKIFVNGVDIENTIEAAKTLNLGKVDVAHRIRWICEDFYDCFEYGTPPEDRFKTILEGHIKTGA